MVQQMKKARIFFSSNLLFIASKGENVISGFTKCVSSKGIKQSTTINFIIHTYLDSVGTIIKPLKNILSKFFYHFEHDYTAQERKYFNSDPYTMLQWCASSIQSYTGWPNKNGTVDTAEFSGLCSDQQLSFFTLLDRASFLIIITPRSSNLVENFFIL